MAQFKYKAIKKMDAKPGVKYSTEYYKQTPPEYTALSKHVDQTIREMILAADQANALGDLEAPLKGFPRTQGRPNYSAFDIMNDLKEQLDHERDLPSGMLGRWQRLFEGTDCQIDMVEDTPPNPVFNKLFYTTR